MKLLQFIHILTPQYYHIENFIPQNRPWYAKKILLQILTMNYKRTLTERGFDDVRDIWLGFEAMTRTGTSHIIVSIFTRFGTRLARKSFRSPLSNPFFLKSGSFRSSVPMNSSLADVVTSQCNRHRTETKKVLLDMSLKDEIKFAYKKQARCYG